MYDEKIENLIEYFENSKLVDFIEYSENGFLLYSYKNNGLQYETLLNIIFNDTNIKFYLHDNFDNFITIFENYNDYENFVKKVNCVIN